MAELQASLLGYFHSKSLVFLLPLMFAISCCEIALTDAKPDIIQSKRAVVAADNGPCSEVGASILKKGGHAVDAAVAAAVCLGVVSPSSSGIGGGAFMVVRSSSGAVAIDMRETAPKNASENMYEKNPGAKSQGVLSMGVPGEIAGLHVAWLRFGRLPWKTLLEPAVKLAKQGFLVSPYLAKKLSEKAKLIKSDPGLSRVYAPNGRLLKSGQICYNVQLGNSLNAIANQGPGAMYNGEVGERLIGDMKKIGGILTIDDLRKYKVLVTNVVSVNVTGYEILGMPPPSSGTVGLSFILNVLDSYRSRNAAKGPLGLHRLIESLKHMFAIRMNLGDPEFVNITETVNNMLSPSFARSIREKIYDNTTFPSEYYMQGQTWDQITDHGTSHLCVVDSERNAVSLTTTVNYAFGGGVLSPSTGIILNNEMDDFSIPTNVSSSKLPPAPTNFIKPNKRPLSSMTPIIILKDNQLAGVIGCCGGINIVPAVAEVFINHFILGMEPLAAVHRARVYHKLIPNVVSYENFTALDGEHIQLSGIRQKFLRSRGHKLLGVEGRAMCTLVVHDLKKTFGINGTNKNVVRGLLTAVSDLRKGGWPAAI